MKPPKKPKNEEQRTREFLSTQEIEAVRKHARKNPSYGHRNDTLILMMFKHALRVSEAINLQWEQVDFTQGKLYVNRLKNGRSSTHPLHGKTIRALRLLQRKYGDVPYLFCTAQKHPSLRVACTESLPMQEKTPVSLSLFIRICSDTVPVFIWPIKASIPEPFRSIWDTHASITPSSTRSSMLTALITSGGRIS